MADFPAHYIFCFEVFEDVLLYDADLFAKVFGFLELFFLAVLLKKRGVAEPDVLDFAREFVDPFGDVHLVGFPSDFAHPAFGFGGVG